MVHLRGVSRAVAFYLALPTILPRDETNGFPLVFSNRIDLSAQIGLNHVESLVGASTPACGASSGCRRLLYLHRR